MAAIRSHSRRHQSSQGPILAAQFVKRNLEAKHSSLTPAVKSTDDVVTI